MEPKESHIMRDEHLDIISETESDEFIKFSVENLVPRPSDSGDECKCDMPACDDFTTFSNLLFDSDDDFSSSDDKSFSDEDIPKEIYSNPLFDEEIISIKIDMHHFNAESDLIESLLNQDSSIIHLLRRLILFLMSSDPFMEEIDLFLASDGSIPPGTDSDYLDFEGDNIFLERLLHDDPIPLPENESFHFDIPSSPRPPAKPPDDDEIKPNLGMLTVKVWVIFLNIMFLCLDFFPPLLQIR
nr:hypothetical protein [Tanacetum cinerariifolium]